MTTKQIGSKIPIQHAEKLQEIAVKQSVTMSDIIKIAIENYLNPSNNTENSAEILSENQRLKAIFEQQTQQLSQQAAEIEQLRNQEPQQIEIVTEKQIPIQLQENQCIVTLAPVVKHFLDKTKALIEKQTGKTVAYETILVNLFWSYVKEGPGDHLPINISNREIRQVVEHYRTAQL